MSNITYNYEIAKSLTENEKNRLICVFLNAPAGVHNQADWKKAAAEFGSANADSMKVSTATIFKKLKQASDGETTPAKPAGKKRKAAGQDGDDAEDTPKPKKGRGKGKKAAAETNGNDSSSNETPVKPEVGDDL
ncbi:uncharacterized protein LTR77_007106 [Saxophila tyrrhenica]|uniref:Uncharacterized protein n=1 Tax=Saxophila tyrrhenica TaxID=1690608 RepID=A0AAV9P6P7_9PEZI|nr:hypothetical protein LTR77_007106 [Saxophila tyrrhenica]